MYLQFAHQRMSLQDLHHKFPGDEITFHVMNPAAVVQVATGSLSTQCPIDKLENRASIECA